MSDDPKKTSFTRSPVPPPVTPVAPKLDTSKLGNMPIAKDKAILTDQTRKNLELIGWEEGDDIPPALGKRIAAMKKAREAELEKADHGFEPGTKVKIDRTINLADLPQEKQDELRQVLAEHKAEMQIQAAQDEADQAIHKTIPGADPSVFAAAQTAKSANLPGMPEVELVYKEPENAPQPAAAPEPAPAPADPEDTEDTEQDAGADAAPHYCPRCMYDVNDEFSLNPSEHDRKLFMASLLGTNRFTKAYELSDGALVVMLRSLTTREVDLVFKQMQLDANAGLITGEGDWFLRLERYRTLCCLVNVKNAEGAILVEVPPLFELPYTGEADEKGIVEETRLVVLTEWFVANVIKTESMRRIISQHYRDFTRLVEAMEAQTAEPDFWKGTESQA